MTPVLSVHSGTHTFVDYIRNTSYMVEDGVTIIRHGNWHTGYEIYLQWDGLMTDPNIEIVEIDLTGGNVNDPPTMAFVKEY